MPTTHAFAWQSEVLVVETSDAVAKLVDRKRVPRLAGVADAGDGRFVYFIRAPSEESVPSPNEAEPPRARVYDESGLELAIGGNACVSSALYAGDVLYLGGGRAELVHRSNERPRGRRVWTEYVTKPWVSAWD